MVYVLSDLHDITKLLKILENRSDWVSVFLIIENTYDREIYKVLKPDDSVFILTKKQFLDSKNIIADIINMNFGFMPYYEEDDNSTLFPLDTFDKNDNDVSLDYDDYIALLKTGYSYAATEEFIGKEPVSNILTKTLNNFQNLTEIKAFILQYTFGSGVKIEMISKHYEILENTTQNPDIEIYFATRKIISLPKNYIKLTMIGMY